MAALLSHPAVLKALTGESVPLWNCCVLACASVDLELYHEALGFSIEPHSIKIPSFHIIGVEDVARSKSETALELFSYKREKQIVRSTVYISSGHGVPSSMIRDVGYRREFNVWTSVVGGERTLARAAGILDNVTSLGAGSLPWFKKKAHINVPANIARALSKDLGMSKAMSLQLSGPRLSNPKESYGPTISFSKALSLKNEMSLATQSLLLDEVDFEFSEERVSTLLEALERLELEDPLRMSNGMNFRFDKSNLALLLADPGVRNTWYSNGSIHALLERSPADAPLIRDAARPAASAARTTTYGDVLQFVSGQGDIRHSIAGGDGADSSAPPSPAPSVASADVVVVYPAPPGPLGAVVLLTVATQCTAMPLDPDAKYEDYKVALSQVVENGKGAKNTLVALAFRGISSGEFVRAATDAGVHVAWQRPRDDLKPGMYEAEHPVPGAGRAAEPLRNGPEDVALLLRTSGSTATPKVVPIRNEALAANAVALAKSLKLTPEDVALNAMPLFHIGGIAASVLASVAGGASLMCMDRFETGSFYNTITAQRGQGNDPTWFTAVPTMHLSLMMYGKQEPASPKHSLRFIRTGAAPLSEADAVALSSFWGVDIVSTYSMTEQMPISSTMSQSKPGTVGNPLLVSLALVSPDTLKPVSWGDPGEICICADTVISEYYNNTGDAKPFFFIGDRRFFRTGDMGLLDDDRFLFIVGRLKELIKMGGEQISPVEIESVVRRHPDVNVAVAFGVPSPTWGEEVGIAVVLGDQSSSKRLVTDVQADVKQFARDALGVSKAPRYWKFLDDASVLPMTASRKYIRNGLAAVLGIEAETFDAQTAPPKGVARLSSGLSGLRYVLSVGVMFNHIGAVWQGEDERNPMTWGQNFFPGKASTFYFPATAFFVLGGYSLSAALAAREVKSYWSFVSSRFKTLLPLYWFALILALINLLVVCRPETYSDSFSWQPNMETRTLSDGSYAQCQSGPVELPYGWWLFLTLLVFFTGMQAWFFAFILAGTGFGDLEFGAAAGTHAHSRSSLRYSQVGSFTIAGSSASTSSVRISRTLSLSLALSLSLSLSPAHSPPPPPPSPVLLVFKWMHNALVRSRGKGRDILIWGAVYTLGVRIGLVRRRPPPDSHSLTHSLRPVARSCCPRSPWAPTTSSRRGRRRSTRQRPRACRTISPTCTRCRPCCFHPTGCRS